MALAKPANLTIRSIIAAFSEYLSGKAVDSPRLSADLICMHVLGVDRLALMVEPDRTVSPEQWTIMAALAKRRGAGEPAAYLFGTREFYGRDFSVTPATLIPRPETEHIIEEITARVPRSTPLRFADLGTGSGCIAVTLLCELPQALGIAVDMSCEALTTARANAQTHDVANRLTCVQGDFTTPLFRHHSLACIATNPPYVSEAEYAELSHEVRDFEPKTALVPGSTGLEHAAHLIRNASAWLAPGGIFIMEMGYTQADAVLDLFTPVATAWESQSIIHDLAGLDRHVLAIRASE